MNSSRNKKSPTENTRNQVKRQHMQWQKNRADQANNKKYNENKIKAKINKNSDINAENIMRYVLTKPGLKTIWSGSALSTFVDMEKKKAKGPPTQNTQKKITPKNITPKNITPKNNTKKHNTKK